MTQTVFRLGKYAHRAELFSGQGGLYASGRWPPPRQAGGESAILQVPSAIVIEEWNYLLNPLHADFKSFTCSQPEPFGFDRRLVRAKKKV